MGLSSAVWERESSRYGEREMSKNAFAALITLWTAVGIGSSAFAAMYSLHWHATWLLAIGVLAVSIAGVFISLKSDNPIVSLLGYGMITIPFGLLFGPVVAHYTKASVFSVLGVTTMVVVALGLVGALYPKSLESWWSFLFTGLLVLLFGQIFVGVAASLGAPVQGALKLWDWVGVFLFSGYVVFDMNRAMRVERTLDNSIDCAVAIYLDFANLFIRLLQLTGKSKDD